VGDRRQAVLAVLAVPVQARQLVIPATKGTEACTLGGWSELRPTAGVNISGSPTVNSVTISTPGLTNGQLRNMGNPGSVPGSGKPVYLQVMENRRGAQDSRDNQKPGVRHIGNERKPVWQPEKQYALCRSSLLGYCECFKSPDTPLLQDPRGVGGQSCCPSFRRWFEERVLCGRHDAAGRHGMLLRRAATRSLPARTGLWGARTPAEPCRTA